MSDDPIEVPPGFIYRPYIPLQVTPTLLNPEPDVIEKLAATVDPELKAKHLANEAANRHDQQWIGEIMKRHGKKLKRVDGKYFDQADVTNL